MKKIMTIALTVLLVNLGIGTVSAKSNSEKEIRQAAKVKQAITNFGTGQTAHVKISLRDKTKLEGFVSSIGDETFSITDSKSGVATIVDFKQVKKAKGNNLSTGAKFAIGVGIAVAVVAVVMIATRTSIGFGRNRRLEDAFPR